MGDFLDCFASEMNQTALIYSQSVVYANGTSTKTYTSSPISVQCGFWTGAQAESLVSERFKSVIDGVVILNPALLNSQTISRDAKILIGSTNYSVVNPDDIMLQGEVMIIGVKEFT